MGPESDAIELGDLGDSLLKSTRHPLAWSIRQPGWRQRVDKTDADANIRYVAASCTMMLSSFLIVVSCLSIILSEWGCRGTDDCSTKCTFLATLTLQTLVIGAVATSLFLATAPNFPANSPYLRLPFILAVVTVITYHWVIYGTYIQITGDPCPSQQLENAFTVVLVVGHVVIGLPAFTAALAIKAARSARGNAALNDNILDDRSPFMPKDAKHATPDEKNGLLAHES